MFWGFLGVWLLKACQDQGRVVLGVGVALSGSVGASTLDSVWECGCLNLLTLLQATKLRVASSGVRAYGAVWAGDPVYQGGVGGRSEERFRPAGGDGPRFPSVWPKPGR